MATKKTAKVKKQKMFVEVEPDPIEIHPDERILGGSMKYINPKIKQFYVNKKKKSTGDR